MAIQFNAVKCPECGATLEVEKERSMFFCSYCGTKIIATDEYERTYRIVDEAKVKQAETERIVRLRELDLEEEKTRSNKRNDAVAYAIAILFAAAGIALLIAQQPAGVICCLIGMVVALNASVTKDQERQKEESNRKAAQGYIEISDYIANYKNKDYHVIEESLHTLGFTNVTSVNLKDIVQGSKKKRGAVQDVTVNGERLDCDFYRPNDKIVISYHDFK